MVAGYVVTWKRGKGRITFKDFSLTKAEANRVVAFLKKEGAFNIKMTRVKDVAKASRAIAGVRLVRIAKAIREG